MHSPKALSLQEEFAASDDAAELLSRNSSTPQIVDATSSSLGALIELLMLKRSVNGIFTIRDRSRRGHLLRQLLSGEDAFSCAEGLGMYHAAPGNAATASEATDFSDQARIALRTAGVADSASLRLSGALRELLDNVDEHGGCAATCLAGYFVQPREAWVCVADTGDGVLAGYKQSVTGSTPGSAEEALHWAVIEHRSRTGLPGRGTGFQTVVQALRSIDGSIRVRSDDASIELEQSGSSVDALLRKQGHLPGFVVSMHLRWRSA